MKRFLAIILILGFAVTLFSQETTVEKLDRLLKGYTETGRFNGSALIASHGKILLEKGYGYKNFKGRTLNDTCTIFQIASVTKQFTSAVILKLVELNKLSLNDRLKKFYPDFPKGESISIENLLTHTSGIFDWTQSINFSPTSEQTLLGFLKTKALDFSPGTRWSYSNSNYSLLGYIIQKASGMSYEDAVRKYIFNPLHMNHSGFDFKNLVSKEKATGYSTFSDSSKIAGILYDSIGPFAAGEIYSTVGDLYKWHRGLQSSHSGDISGFSSNLARITEDNVFIILLNNKEESGLEAITRDILAILYSQPYSIPVKRHPVKLDEEILKKYIGAYELISPPGPIQGEVTFEKGKLMMQVKSGAKVELIAEKRDYFFDLFDDTEGDVEFVTGSNGKVNGIVLSRNGVTLSGKKIR